jgi:hypothetical protein
MSYTLLAKLFIVYPHMCVHFFTYNSFICATKVHTYKKRTNRNLKKVIHPKEKEKKEKGIKKISC